MYNSYPFELKPLDFGPKELEPRISERTLGFHHGKHLKAYVDNLNKALENFTEYHNLPLEKLLYNIEQLPESIRTAVKNNGGGVYNHNLYFELLSPEKTEPKDELLRAINEDFGSVSDMLSRLKAEAVKVFGSGYGILACDAEGKLLITGVANQDTLVPKNLHPVLVLDVWEHAYYLDYQNLRADYIDKWREIINWPKALELYKSYRNLDYSRI